MCSNAFLKYLELYISGFIHFPKLCQTDRKWRLQICKEYAKKIVKIFKVINSEWYGLTFSRKEHQLSRKRNIENLEGALYKIIYTLLRLRALGYAPIHAEDSNRIPRCLTPASHSSIRKYLNSYVATMFCSFSFKHPLYYSCLHCCDYFFNYKNVPLEVFL